VADGQRDNLKAYLQEKGIPAMIYYPVPLYRQQAFAAAWHGPDAGYPVTEALCASVVSLPMHSELNEVPLKEITDGVSEFYS